MSSFVATAPCCECGEPIPIDGAPRCTWIRPAPCHVKVRDLVVGDIVRMSLSRKANTFDVVRIDPRDDGIIAVWTRLSNNRTAKPEMRSARPGFYALADRPRRCGNYTCEAHRREPSASIVICSQCWSLQRDLVAGQKATCVLPQDPSLLQLPTA